MPADSLYADILAGYDANTTSDIKGDPINGSAFITSVTFSKNVTGVNIVAGAEPGTNGFGKGDTQIPPASGVTPLSSTIGSITIDGTVGNSGVANATFGFVATLVSAVKIDGVALALASGPGNDDLLISGSDTTVHEVGAA